MVAVTESHFWSWNWSLCLLSPQWKMQQEALKHVSTAGGAEVARQGVVPACGAEWGGDESSLRGWLLARSRQAGWLLPAWPRCPGAPTPPASPTGTCDRAEGGLGRAEAGRLLMCSCWARSTDLGILFGMALGNQGLEECAITGILRDKLQYRNRLQYMVTVGPRRAPHPSPLATGM